MSGDDDLISISAAADAIGINKSTLSRQVKAGLIRSHGGKVRLTEVIEDRKKNIGASRATETGAQPLHAPVAQPLHEAVARNDATQRGTPRCADDATPIGDALELISISAAAKAIGINKSTLKRQIDSGAVRSHDGKVRSRSSRIGPRTSTSASRRVSARKALQLRPRPSQRKATNSASSRWCWSTVRF